MKKSKTTQIKQYLKFNGYDLRTKKAKQLIKKLKKEKNWLDNKKLTIKQFVKIQGYDLRKAKTKRTIKELQSQLKIIKSLKTKPPKIKINAAQKQTIGTLKKFAEDLEKAIKYNEQNISTSKLLARHKEDILNPQKKRLEEIRKAIKSIETTKMNPTAKDMAVFRQAFSNPVFKIENAYSQEALVYDRDTNFKNMVLAQLQAEGVDIYNPEELNKILKGNEIVDLAEFIELDEGENWYKYLQTGAKTTIKDLVRKKEAYEASIRKQYKIPKGWEIS